MAYSPRSTYWDGGRSGMSRTMSTAKKSSSSASPTVYWMPPPYSEMSGLFSGKISPWHIREWLMSLPQDSHASRFPLPESERGQRTSGTCGPQQLGLLPLSGLDTFCLKMCPESAATCPWSSETCAGLATPSDVLSLLPPPQWVQDIYAGASGYMPKRSMGITTARVRQETAATAWRL